MKVSEMKQAFQNGEYDAMLADLYADESVVGGQKERYIQAMDRFMELYGDQEAGLYTSAGRSEVSGNHTDHQHGRVLAASISLDSIAVAAPTDDNTVHVVSDGYNIRPVSLDHLEPVKEEESTSEALIRGVAASLKEAGHELGGFRAFITSNVLNGAGLSSSASFEVLIGTILSGLYNEDSIDMVEIAKASQKAENRFFGKPCGLMDQCACAVGGLITIDFEDPASPVVHPVEADFSRYGYSLCIVDTKGDHADLTPDYAAIPAEMKKVAAYLGKDVLREVDEEEFYERLPEIREALDDRSVLRAIHFFNENARVPQIVAALESDDFSAFLKGIEDSGNSSYKFLQNIYSSTDPENQAVAIGLAMSENLLGPHGVSRVHGGGFAGTIQAFVENAYVPTYKEGIEKVFGEGSCHVLKVRPDGGKHLI